jgi:hypothetical protein
MLLASAALGIVWIAAAFAVLAVDWWTDEAGKGITWKQLSLASLFAPVLGAFYLFVTVCFVILTTPFVAIDSSSTEASRIPRRRRHAGIALWWNSTLIPPRQRR